MEPKKHALALRPYHAIIWGREPESIGVRAVYYATDGDAAKRQAIQEHGEYCIFSIWNEEDANKLRSNEEAEQGGDGDAEEAV